MANEVKAVKAATEPEVPKKPEFVYVTIPETDMFDYPHPGVGINQNHYGPGTHYVPKAIADEIIRVCAVFDAQNVRILQPKRDMKALTALYKNRGAQSVDMTPDLTKQV
jgi:hypothetical protein